MQIIRYKHVNRNVFCQIRVIFSYQVIGHLKA